MRHRPACPGAPGAAQAGRTVLTQLVQPDRGYRNPPVLEVVAAGQPLPLSQVPSQLHPDRNGKRWRMAAVPRR